MYRHSSEIYTTYLTPSRRMPPGRKFRIGPATSWETVCSTDRKLSIPGSVIGDYRVSLSECGTVCEVMVEADLPELVDDHECPAQRGLLDEIVEDRRNQEGRPILIRDVNLGGCKGAQPPRPTFACSRDLSRWSPVDRPSTLPSQYIHDPPQHAPSHVV